jgi:exosortase
LSTPEEIWHARRAAQSHFLATAVLVLFLGLLYASILEHLALQWWKNPDYSHGFVVPVFSAFILWRQRHRWLEVELAPSNLGLPVMFFAVALLVAGTLGAELFISRISLLFLIAGMVLYLGGWKLIRAVAFPLGFLAFMVPLPGIIFYQITFPLQLLASRFAAFLLDLARVPVLREGNLLILPNYTMEVVEACSGIRSLVSLAALAVAFSYLMEGTWWRRILLLASVVPIAIVSNGLRVVATGALVYLVGPEVLEGVFHEVAGLLVFLTAVALMMAVHWFLGFFGKREPNSDVA